MRKIVGHCDARRKKLQPICPFWICKILLGQPWTQVILVFLPNILEYAFLGYFPNGSLQRLAKQSCDVLIAVLRLLFISLAWKPHNFESRNLRICQNPRWLRTKKPTPRLVFGVLEGKPSPAVVWDLVRVSFEIRIRWAHDSRGQEAVDKRKAEADAKAKAPRSNLWALRDDMLHKHLTLHNMFLLFNIS